MGAVDFDDLIRHDGHDIKLTYFGLEGKRENAVNVAIVCDTCEEVLFDYDKEEKFDKRTIRTIKHFRQNQYSGNLNES